MDSTWTGPLPPIVFPPDLYKRVRLSLVLHRAEGLAVGNRHLVVTFPFPHLFRPRKKKLSNPHSAGRLRRCSANMVLQSFMVAGRRFDIDSQYTLIKPLGQGGQPASPSLGSPPEMELMRADESWLQEQTASLCEWSTPPCCYCRAELCA